MSNNKRDYLKLKRVAYDYIVIQGKTQKEAAAILRVTEQTMSEWAKEGGWRNIRKGRQSAESTSIENIRNIIALASGKRLAIEDEINMAAESDDKELELDLRKQASAISDEISKYNATLKNMEKTGGITLGIFVDVMDEVFNALRLYDESLFDKTIDFQGYLTRKKINELG